MLFLHIDSNKGFTLAEISTCNATHYGDDLHDQQAYDLYY